MYIFKYRLILLCLIGLVSCKSVWPALDFNATISSPDFYTGLKLDIAPAKVDIYKTSFIQLPVEDRHVVEMAVLNEYSKQQAELHRAGDTGSRQVLYLLMVCDASDDCLYTIYLSTNYDKLGQFKGFGPSYVGTFDTGLKIIYFYNYLSLGKKNPYTANLAKKAKLYMSFNSFRQKDHIRIEKLIVEDKNKLGGKKEMVIDINKSFKGLKYLQFDFQETIPIK